MTLENSPSKVAAADQPLSHFFSAEAVTSTESLAWAAPLTTKDAPGSSWNVAPILRLELKSCAHATRPRRVRTPSCIPYDLSARRPSSLRVSVTLFDA